MIMAPHVAAAASSAAACLTQTKHPPHRSRWNRVAPLPTSPSRRPLQAQAAARTDRPRHAVVVRCEKKKKGAADEPAGEPGPEEGGDPHQSPSYQQYRKFQDVIDQLQQCAAELRARRSLKKDDMDGQGRMLTMTLLLRAKDAIELASTIMTDAHLRAQTPNEISLHTVDQTVRMYVSTFFKTAEDTYHRKVDRATILSFLCALQGLAAVSHILFEDALAFVRRSQPDYSPKHDVEVINRYYQQEIKRLINNFREASTTEALEILHSTCKSTLAHVPGRTIASCDAAPPDDRQNE